MHIFTLYCFGLDFSTHLKKQLNGLEKYHFKPNVFNWKNLVVF
jgi:hypothetical protein